MVGYTRCGQEQQGHAAFDALRVATIAALAGADGDDLEDRANAWASLVARTRARSRLKMPDAVVLATAQHVGGFVATLDDALHRAAHDANCLFTPTIDIPTTGGPPRVPLTG
jgi:fumarate hydratase class II